MIYDANRKSAGVAYLLWLFIGMTGAHRFYLGRTGTAATQLALFVLGLLTLVAGVGFVFLGIEAVWVVFDAFLIGSIVREHNMRIADGLSKDAVKATRAAAPTATTDRSAVEQLDQLWRLRQAGALSQNEYDAQKSRLLSSS